MNNLRENYKEFIKSTKLILKSQQRFRSKKQNVFTEESISLHRALTMIKEYNQ